ncbi:MAG: ROK family protein [Acidobacteriota bacterium]|nr:ROK family protein [Acidobacteriota bacterium]MDH3530661.1 ROK family protein [Acidobacteriota bacterium]
MKDIVLAADLGGTNLRMAAVSKNGDIHTHVKRKTPASKTSKDIVSIVTSAAKECVAGLNSVPEAIAIAVPGTISSRTGAITRAPNIPGLDRFDLVAALNEECRYPVIIENDANAAAIGENWLGSSKDSDTSIMVTLGTGVGGGIIIDGKILRGLDGTAGEIGHVSVEPNGLPCGCGSFGCLEQYASATAVINMALKAVESDPEINPPPGRIHDAETVFRIAESGEGWARDIFERQGFYLGIVVAGLINCLNPEVIVIGGGAAAAWDAFMPALKEQVVKRTYADACARARIVPAALGDNAGILGVARLGFEKVRSGLDVVV